MIFSRRERNSLSIFMAIVFSYAITLDIYQQHCFNDFRYKNVWIKRNKERQQHEVTYRIDLDNGPIPESERNKLFCFSEGLANACSGDKWGFINQNGEWVIPPRFSGAWPFENGLAGVMRKDKFGFIDETGRMIIWPRFDNIRDFSGRGLAAVQFKGLWGFIDTNGRFVIQPTFEWADSFNDELALVKKNGLYGYIDSGGQFVIQPTFKDGLRFQEGLAGVRIDDKYGFINSQGKWVIKPRYDQVVGFSEGMAAVQLNGSLSYINKSGKIVLQNNFTSLGNFHNGIAVALFSNHAYLLTQTGKIIPTGFQNMQDFMGNYAVVKIGEKYGFCDRQLNRVGHFLYKEVWPYSQGLAAVQVGKRIEFIREGTLAIKPKFDWANPDKY